MHTNMKIISGSKNVLDSSFRAYILGKDISLVGTRYNTGKENCDISLTESSFTKYDPSEKALSDESLDKELCLSAMLFSVSEEEDPFFGEHQNC